ncbi:hypothetical protein A33M_1933 [Rhodovulum sp. PH10]|uniref:hypothetical protein n=1 Tax=Rhodovulum sp. PH10 TaxID=1187851 RepID=UPI00027C2A04|nr:hypothetical protein [Rhodovulum sp. PH10]EJW12573.1 hypothetical protein A33M_1933 [Rhodovulum sp. PH10]
MDCRYLEPQEIAEMLRGAVTEIAAMCREPSATPETLAQSERWTARWIDLVAAMLWDAPPGEGSEELRTALADLREVAAMIDGRLPPRRPAITEREVLHG